MEKIYILIYQSIEKVDRNEFVKFLEDKKAIDYWEYCLPNSLFLQSSLSSEQLSDLFEEKYGEENHIVIETNLANYWGRLPDGYWEIFK